MPFDEDHLTAARFLTPPPPLLVDSLNCSYSKLSVTANHYVPCMCALCKKFLTVPGVLSHKLTLFIVKLQIENTKIIQDLRDEIARLREKLATSGRTGGTNKDDVLQMEVTQLRLRLTQSVKSESFLLGNC